MTDREMKKMSESFTVQTHLLFPMHLNASGTLFGGQLLNWIDMIAAITANRHADSNTVTASIDHLDFINTAAKSDVVTLEAKVTWTGNTSLEVRVDTFRENKGGARTLINTAFLIMVAVDDETHKPKPVPGLIIETEEQQAEWDAAVKRVANRKLRRQESF